MDANIIAPTISLNGVSKAYTTYEKPWHRLAELLSGNRRKLGHRVNALSDVSLELQKGDRLGIVGENGSGKSTLLKVISGVLTPTSGSVSVRGRVSALLELGAGFNGDLSGRDNIEAFGVIHGLSSDEIQEAIPKIIAFSELGEFINYPVKTYSSGMGVRLGFACAVYVRPDILIVDEALSVGDAYFQNKCLHKIKSLLDDGVTFIYVTHTADSVRALCNKGLWMEKGRPKLFASSSEVGERYNAAMFEKISHSQQTERVVDGNPDTGSEPSATLSNNEVDHSRAKAFAERVEALRTGSGEVRITDISICSDVDSVEIDELLRIKVYLRQFAKMPDDCALAVGITDKMGRQILHFSSAVKNIYLNNMSIGHNACIEFRFNNVLCPGEYGIIAGIGPLDKHPQSDSLSVPKQVVDYCVGGARFSVRFPNSGDIKDLWGVVHTPYEVIHVI